MATATRRVVRTMPQMFIDVADNQSERLQVAAYARVSTEKEEQEDSFERQVEHYKQLIYSKPEWQFVDVYADPGISGTRAEKRPDFLRMIEDCRAGKIKKVLVKSISRFARNTVDALQYIRELKDLGISVYFESENIDTLTPGGEVLLTILAAMAEQESRTISSNIKWAWQRKFQKGDIILNTGLMLGYRRVGKDDEGHDVYEIKEEEAEIVRRIYREFIAGYSITQIAKRLQADGVKTKLGRESWRHNVIESILTNEKYTGNALLGKTFKPDVLTKYRQKNDGKNHHPYHGQRKPENRRAKAPQLYGPKSPRGKSHRQSGASQCKRGIHRQNDPPSEAGMFHLRRLPSAVYRIQKSQGISHGQSLAISLRFGKKLIQNRSLNL